jgi:4-hydroxy-tetrahydrodipicolinate synthase
MNQKSNTELLKIVSQPKVWTALITPLFDNGDIDYVSLRNAVLIQNSAENGILLLGSTGEGIALASDEQLAIVEYVCAMSLKVPLMVAVGGANLTEQLAWIHQCNVLPIHGYLLGSPLYAKPGAVGQAQWYKTLLDAAKLPCMLYNVPSRSGIELAISALQSIQNHRNCWALKEASGDLNKLLAYRQHCRELVLFSGEDAMMPYLASVGVKGLVSVCANVWPKETKRYVELALAGNTDGLFPVWKNAVDALFQASSPIPVKALMAELKIIASAQLRLPLSPQDLPKNHDLLSAHQAIEQWFEQAELVTNMNQITGVNTTKSNQQREVS